MRKIRKIIAAYFYRKVIALYTTQKDMETFYPKGSTAREFAILKNRIADFYYSIASALVDFEE